MLKGGQRCPLVVVLHISLGSNPFCVWPGSTGSVPWEENDAELEEEEDESFPYLHVKGEQRFPEKQRLDCLESVYTVFPRKLSTTALKILKHNQY